MARNTIYSLTLLLGVGGLFRDSMVLLVKSDKSTPLFISSSNFGKGFMISESDRDILGRLRLLGAGFVVLLLNFVMMNVRHFMLMIKDIKRIK